MILVLLGLLIEFDLIGNPELVGELTLMTASLIVLMIIVVWFSDWLNPPKENYKLPIKLGFTLILVVATIIKVS